MAKGKIIKSILAVAIMLVGVLSILGIQHQKKYFLMNLKISQVESIIIDSDWGQAELSESEISDLINQLNKIELISKGNLGPSVINGGRLYMFHIKLTNNREFDFSVSRPYYIIDGQMLYDADNTLVREIKETYRSLEKKYFPRNQN